MWIPMVLWICDMLLVPVVVLLLGVFGVCEMRTYAAYKSCQEMENVTSFVTTSCTTIIIGSVVVIVVVVVVVVDFFLVNSAYATKGNTGCGVK